MPAYAETPTWQALSRAAPTADPAVIRLALDAMFCAMKTSHQESQRLAVIDYSRPSTEPRLWVFDLASGKLLFRELVAHGRNSGDKYATTFSNAPNSLASSLGLYRTLLPYNGDNGYSLRLEGLEPGFNQNALDRAIVMHGARYVSQKFVAKTGRIGRSYGCPAVRKAAARSIIDSLKGGNYLFAYYPDAEWLKTSAYLRCNVQAPAVQTQVVNSESANTHLAQADDTAN